MTPAPPRPILLIEDNPDDVDLTLRAFRKNHIANEVVNLTDGVAAVSYLLDEPGPSVVPALVLLDLKLPKLSGLDVLRRLRADPRTRRLPIVILTSSSEEQDMIAGYDLGANSFVRKPIDFERFATAVQQLGIYWLMLNEPPPR